MASEPIEALPAAVAESAEFLADEPEATRRLAALMALTEGHESAYSLELLATAHWVVHEQGLTAGDAADVSWHIHHWNERKAGLFGVEHVQRALEHLLNHELIPA